MNLCGYQYRKYHQWKQQNAEVVSLRNSVEVVTSEIVQCGNCERQKQYRVEV